MPNSTFPFAATSIERIKPTNQQQWFSDAKQQNLSLCVLPSGKRRFYFYGRINGRLLGQGLADILDVPDRHASVCFHFRLAHALIVVDLVLPAVQKSPVKIQDVPDVLADTAVEGRQVIIPVLVIAEFIDHGTEVD